MNNWPVECEFFYKEYALIDEFTIPEFEELIRPLVEKAIDVAARALRKAEMSPSELDRILLAGGTSQMPLVKDLLEDRFRRPTAIAPHDLMWLIAKGAAVHHRNLMTRPREAIEPRLGADLFLETYDRGRLEPVILIPSHQKVPCTYSRRFHMNPQAPYLTVQLLTESGSDGHAIVPLERREITIQGVRLREIEVGVQVDQSRLIRMSVRDPKTGLALDDHIEIRGDVLITPEQIRRAREHYRFDRFDFGAPSGESQSVAVGIDLGTTTCEAVVCQGERGTFEKGLDSELHSKVYVGADGDLKVGGMDKNPGEEGYFENFKADIGVQPGPESGYMAYGTYWPPDILSGHLLNDVWRRLQGKHGVSSKLTDAVITVPSDFTEDQNALVSNAAKIAGIDTPVLLTEPVAAFLAYVADFPELDKAGSNYLVFDFGGGTTDVCVIHTLNSQLPEIVSSSGNNRSGGKDITSLLAEEIIRRFEQKNGLVLSADEKTPVRARALQLAEQTKVGISDMLLAL